MLFFLTIFVVILAAVTLAFVARLSRRETRYFPDDNPLNIDASQFRPLFAPTEEDLAKVEREKQAEIDAEREQNNRLELEKKLANFEEFRQTWRASVNKISTVELLTRAVEFQSSEVFLETVQAILNERQSIDFSNEDLARLIESHFWLLPANERTPGVTFAVNEEIAALRRRSEPPA
jgi:hypothetical protein